MLRPTGPMQKDRDENRVPQVLCEMGSSLAYRFTEPMCSVQQF